LWLSLGAVASTQAQDVPQFSVGAWRGVAYPASGQTPAGCAAGTSFTNGENVEFVLTSGMALGVLIGKQGGRPEWAPSDATGPIRAWVDDETEFAFTGRVRGTDVILEVGPIQARAGASSFRALGEGRVLNVSLGGRTQRYALHGTYGMLAELVGCALKVRAGEVAFPGPPPAPPPTAVAPPAAAAGTIAAPPQPPALPPRPRETGSGSGVVLTEAGHVLTADHVIETCRTVRVAQVGEPPVDAAVVGRDSRNDLAVLRARTTFAATAALRIDAARNGEPVVAFGFPLGGLLASTGNVTFGNVSALVGLRDDSSMLQVSAPVQPGNSGGPLLDAGGLIIGIVQSKLDALTVARRHGDIPQNVNFAMKASVALGFLQAYGVEPRLERRGPDLPQADVTALAQRVTVRVLCLE
jgi:S1-C subfamily serine protease